MTIFCALPVSAFDPDQYRGHLNLEKTTLVVTEVLGGLADVPWEITIAADGWLWYSLQSGSVNRLNPDTGDTQRVLQLDDVYYKKSFGLLGFALHPEFNKKPLVFLHYTYRKPAPQKQELIASRLVRYEFREGALRNPKILLTDIPGAGYHNGSRILVTAEDTLFLTTGDAGEPEHSQRLDRLSGKVLRMTIDGRPLADNPFAKYDFPFNLIWSFGHRNAQGITRAANGVLYISDHGANNDDEINVIEAGRNYGWPSVAGYCDHPSERDFCKKKRVVEPVMSWTPTIAPAGLHYFNHPTIPEWRHSLLLANLKGRALRVLKLNAKGAEIDTEHIYFQKRFGRIRDIAVAKNGDIFLATSNTDWHPRYQPWMYDHLPSGGERILKLSPADADSLKRLATLAAPVPITEDTEPMALPTEDWSFQAGAEDVSRGRKLYVTHCASCHGPEGQGAADLIPPLAGTEWVTGDRSRLIQVLLRGLSEPITVKGITYDQEMPSFGHLSDQDIAAVLTFIRTSFGNDSNAILEGEVFEERKILP